MTMVTPPTTGHILGSIRIYSLNQIGESVRYDTKRRCFMLGKHGSEFILVSHTNPANGLNDFREQHAMEVSLLVNGKYLAVDLASREAVLVDPMASGDAPSNAVFRYQRKKFDRFSASISHVGAEGELWFRHCNSKLRV